MRSPRITAWAVGLAVLMATGCASPPSFMGQWHADKLPYGIEAEQASLAINANRTFILTLKDAEGQPRDGEVGMWEKRFPEQVRLYRNTHGDKLDGDPSPAIAQLRGDGTLLLLADKKAIEFRRIE